MIAVLDTEGVEQLAEDQRTQHVRLRVLRRHVDDIVIPAAVLAEGVLTGNPHHDVGVHRLLKGAAVEPVTERLGLRAGSLRIAALRDGATPPPSGVDAIVVAVADHLAAEDDIVIVTSDPDDLQALTQHADHGTRISMKAV